MTTNNRVNLISEALAKLDVNLDEILFVRAPGRVNLVGGHTDYNLGFVLPCSVDRDIIIGAVAIENSGDAVFTSLNFNNTISFQLNDFNFVNHSWVNYIKGIIYQFKKDGLQISGMKGAIHGTIPIGGGMGSSGAYEVAIALCLKYLNNIDISDLDLVIKCFKAEKEFLKIETGIMDQFTSLFGREDSVICIDCKSLNYEVIKLPSDNIKLLVINSNVKREAKSALNQRKMECAKAVEILNKNNVNIESLRDLSVENFEKYKSLLPRTISMRAQHVVYENERVLMAKEALKNGELDKVGILMKESHISLRDYYEVSCKELDYIFEIVKDLDGVYGVRMTGAGFGGCVVVLIDENFEKMIINTVNKKYSILANKNPTIYSCRISKGASKLSIK
ncbi:MAG: galactokinase [Candidatus Helarchaeota archaeon]